MPDCAYPRIGARSSLGEKTRPVRPRTAGSADASSRRSCVCLGNVEEAGMKASATEDPHCRGPERAADSSAASSVRQRRWNTPLVPGRVRKFVAVVPDTQADREDEQGNDERGESGYEERISARSRTGRQMGRTEYLRHDTRKGKGRTTVLPDVVTGHGRHRRELLYQTATVRGMRPHSSRLADSRCRNGSAAGGRRV